MSYNYEYYNGYDSSSNSDDLAIEIVVPIVLVIVIAAIVIFSIYKPCVIVHEREVVILERLGKECNRTLNAGCHCFCPIVYQPRNFSYCYVSQHGTTSSYNGPRINTQAVSLDLQPMEVITRDNASCKLELTLTYKITEPRRALYSVQNLPFMIIRIVQAHVRSKVGEVDLDTLIEDNNCISRINTKLSDDVSRWGASIDFVKLQKLDAGSFQKQLASMKESHIQNSTLSKNAAASKETTIISAQGEAASIVKRAEGQANAVILQARGQADIVLNAARAEAKAILELSRKMPGSIDGLDPARYFLKLKYLETIEELLKTNNVSYVPPEMVNIKVLQALKVNSVVMGK